MDGVLKIGPVQWQLHFPEGGGLSYSDPAYVGFWSEGVAVASSLPLVSLPVSIRREARQIPAGQPLYQGGKNWAMWEEGRDLIFCSGFYEKPAARFYCRLNRESGLVNLFLDPDQEGADPAPYESPLRYPIDQILSWGLLAKCGGLILHSAVAVKDGVGWVFSGRSGAGKSTISELCHQAGWRILNDDRVMVFKRGGTWKVAGTPWHGSGRFSEADEVPLGGVFFIEKSGGEQIVHLTAADARFALLDVAAVPWFEDEWAQSALDAADRFTREALCHRFYFSRNSSAVQALEQFCDQQSGVAA